MQSLDLEVLTAASQWLRQGHRCLLVTVTQTFGASPRPPGSLVAIRADGILVGSVSGGCIEDDLVTRREQLLSQPVGLHAYGVSAEEARRFGLPCGGELEVLVESLSNTQLIDALLQGVSAGSLFCRVVNVRTGEWRLRPVTRELGPAAEETRRVDDEFICVHGPRWRMLIIGASEIAVYLAEMAKTLDYAVTVCDPREEYRGAWRVDHVCLVSDMPDDAVTAFAADARTVIVAVSHDPKLDDMALMEALKSQALYVGAVGSKRTSDERRARLLTLDLTADEVDRLRGPVGLPIGSRTPPEIAVAVCAELVALRNNRRLVAHAEPAFVAG